MNTYKYQIILILTLILSSCQDETEFNTIENNQPEPVRIEKTVENGRFIFSSTESLKATIDDFQNDAIENVEKEFEKLYEKGFRSHNPIVSPDNEQLQAKLSEEIMLRRQMRKSSSNSLSRISSAELKLNFGIKTGVFTSLLEYKPRPKENGFGYGGLLIQMKFI